MASTSRTSNVIKNSKFALIISLAQIILNFASRGIFLEYLGADVLGLNSTAQSLLSFLNLAELGIGTAVAVTLYKPLHDKDHNEICNIVSLQGWFYKRVAMFIIVGSAILMTLFPVIFKDMQLPLWYAYASFLVYLLTSLLSYFFNYRQVILSANQEQYKILISSNVVKILFVIAQIIAISILDNGFIWWLVIQVISSLVITYTLDRAVRTSHPYIRKSKHSGKELRERYPYVLVKIKQVFMHKLTSFIVFQAQPLIVYAYSSLKTVAYYGNYMLIIQGLSIVTDSLFNGLSASVGNLVAAGNKSQINRVFEELYSSRFLLASIMVLATYFLTPYFITVWVGAEYIMETSTLVLILITFFINITRGTVDFYINAYGLFKDVWAPVTEGIINLSMSFALGYYMGINGVIIGGIISQLIIVLCWKPYFLFTEGLNENMSMYIKIFVKHHLSIFVIVGLVYFADIDPYVEFSDNKYIDFAINATTITTTIAVIQFSILYLISQGMRDFTARINNIIKSKFSK